ncbi:MAG TPA: hypothetical protein VJ761_08105 [Ktedonobacteraceae bacterium]|nr:hypothetical protein [Ktedonobacteraceae bacterium]
MNKIRSILATIALTVTILSGLTLQGMGSMAHAASSHHLGSVSSALVVGKSTGSGAKPNGYCPGSTTVDC